MDDAADLPTYVAALLAAKVLLLAVLAAILREQRQRARRLNAELDRLEVQLRARVAAPSDRNGRPASRSSPGPASATGWTLSEPRPKPRRRGRRAGSGRTAPIQGGKY